LLIIPLALILIIALPQPGTALAQEASPHRALPDVVHRGETFDVAVTFTSPSDDFHALSLTEHAPDGWNVAAAASWSHPKANEVKVEDNKVEIAWHGPYKEGVNFTAVYEVTVPGDASRGNYTFSNGKLYYHIGELGDDRDVTGDFVTQVVLPEIAVTPSNLAFGAVRGGLTPGNQTLFIWNSGGSGTTLSWTLYDDADWLEENATYGNSTGVDDKILVGVSVNITGMSVGDYCANITIADPEAVNSPQVIPVTLHISSPPPSEGGGGGGGSPSVRGDVNGDEVVDERDLTILKEIILGLGADTGSEDCNRDGKVDARDLTMIKRIILGIE